MLKKFALAAGVAASMMAYCAVAQAKELKMIVSWPESNTMAYMPGLQLKKNLEALGSDLDIQISGPETVPPFEQITPTSAGIFDLIYTYPAYHSKALTVATNAMEPDMAKIRSSGVMAYMDSYFQKNHNLKLLANVAVGSAGYHCYLRAPLSADGDWKGRKIRGVSTYVGVIEALGGVPVSTDMAEVYSSLEKGVIDGACAPQSVFNATKHFEVAKYRTEPTFGQLISYIAINLDSWNALSDSEKQALEKAAIQTEIDTIRIGNEANTADLAALADKGVKVTEFPTTIGEKVQATYYDSVWALAADCCGADTAAELRKLALDAGLTK